jgi:hypothetical protein
VSQARFVLTPESPPGSPGNLGLHLDDADQVLARLYESFTRLARALGMGHRTEDLADTRCCFWTVYSYVIVYRWETSPLRYPSHRAWCPATGVLLPEAGSQTPVGVVRVAPDALPEGVLV